MKILYYLLFTLAILISFFFINLDETTAANVSIEITDRAPLYDYFGNEIIQVGELLSGEVYQLLNEDSQYYYIAFGNNRAFLSKEFATISKKPSQFMKKTNSTSVIITNRITTIFSNLNSNKGIGYINRNLRYPVLRTVDKDWYEIQIGGKKAYIYKPHTEVDEGIPVLMYHHILQDSENINFRNNMTISVANFEEQMSYLKAQGYRTIFINDLDNYLRYRLNLTGRTVAITFDDGLKSSVVYAYPILRNLGFVATNFLIADRVWKTTYPFNPDILQTVSSTEIVPTGDVFRYETHTSSMHLRDPETNSPYLIVKNFEEIKTDLILSREKIGPNVKYLAYPFGQYDGEAIEAAKAAGISMAFTTKAGKVHLGDNRYELKRLGVSPYHSMETFINRVNN